MVLNLLVRSDMTFGKKSKGQVFLFAFFVLFCLFLTVLNGQDSLFSFASLRPGAKKNPFSYGAKLISQRLGKILYVLNFTN